MWVIGTNGAIPHYEGVNIREAMEEAFELPVRVLNDANAAVLGECFTGAARGLRHVLMLTLGTGVGGGMVLDGRLYGGAGELPESWDIFPWSAMDGPAPAETGDAWSSMPPRRPWFAWPARPPAKRRSMAGRSLPVLPGGTPTMLRVLAAWTGGRGRGGDGPGACVQPRNGADWRWRKRPGSAVSVPPAGAGVGAGDAVLCHWLTGGAGCSGKRCLGWWARPNGGWIAWKIGPLDNGRTI